MSWGVAVHAAATPTELLRAADAAQYAAKRRQRLAAHAGTAARRMPHEPTAAAALLLEAVALLEAARADPAA